MKERWKYAGAWTLVSVTDREGNVTERGERRAGAEGTITGRPRVGERFAFRYHDGSGTLTTSRVSDWSLIELEPDRCRMRVDTKNSVYLFDKGGGVRSQPNRKLTFTLDSTYRYLRRDSLPSR